jgi:esterase/lipase superfamily enzyme
MIATKRPLFINEDADKHMVELSMRSFRLMERANPGRMITAFAFVIPVIPGVAHHPKREFQRIMAGLMIGFCYVSRISKTTFLLLALVVLAGCETGPNILLMNDTPAMSVKSISGTFHRIFVATNRNGQPDGVNFGENRSSKVSYARYTVSVPRGHSPGKIEWPSNVREISTAFAATDVTKINGQSQLTASVNRQLSQLPIGNREAVVFTHGFNTNFAEGLYRFAQIVHDFKLRGIALHYSWPSAGKPHSYIYDQDSVNTARDGLEEVLNGLARSNVSGITLVGHSMGGHLIVETLRQMSIKGSPVFQKKLRGVVLLSPDIDAEVFRTQLRRIIPLPKPFIIFVSNRDKALKLSAKLTGKTQRLGSLTNAGQLKGLDVTLIDISNFEGGDSLNHLTTATSPALITLISGLTRPGQNPAKLENPSRAVALMSNAMLAGNARRIVLDPPDR